MKKGVLLILLCLIGCMLFAQNDISVQDAIVLGCKNIESKLANGQKVVVLNFKAASKTLSNYLIDEITMNLVNGGKLVVVDRSNLDLLQQELSFQTSGEVSDESAQAIGRKLGAEAIVSGSFEPVGKTYQLRMRTIMVETAIVKAMNSYLVKTDSTIFSLLADDNTVNVGVAKNSVVPLGYVEDYSVMGRLGIGTANALCGLGSFCTGHWGDGLIIAGVEALGILFMSMAEAKYDESHDYRRNSSNYDDDYEDSLEEQGRNLWALAIGSWSAAVLYGYIRPFYYHRKGALVATNAKPDGFNFDLIPTKSGDNLVQVSYKVSW